MSRQPVIKNWQGASFKGIDFSKYVTEWSDTRQLGLATHQYLKRRGAENEDMGRDPHVVHVVLSYTGPTSSCAKTRSKQQGRWRCARSKLY
jgi:prophage DNA circulation protein